MKSNFFDTEEKVNQAISAFMSLLEHSGWKLLEQMLDEDIESLRQQLEEGLGDDETKEDIDLVRYKLSFSKEHRNKPRNMIEKLQSSETTEPNPDPFLTKEELVKQRT